MELTPQSNGFLFAVDGSDQDHAAEEAGLQGSLKARFVQTDQRKVWWA